MRIDHKIDKVNKTLQLYFPPKIKINIPIWVTKLQTMYTTSLAFPHSTREQKKNQTNKFSEDAVYKFIFEINFLFVW